MIGLVTDSNSQIPPSLTERFGVTVVPLSVTIDGVTYLEGIDLDADAFYARFGPGRTVPSVSTAQPSPGQFAAAYQGLADAGVASVLSVHIGSAVSGTVNAARLGATKAPVPVHIVDSGTASFAVALCVWAAGEAIEGGADLYVAADAAERTAATTGTVFVLQALDLARAGGRLAAGIEDAPAIPVLTMADGVMQVVGHAADLAQAVDAMAAHVAAAAGGEGTRLRVGVGIGDAAMAPLYEALEGRLADLDGVEEVVRYRIGPSVGVHTGPGTVGVMYGRVNG